MTKQYTISAVASALDAKVIGNGDWLVRRVAHPADIEGEGDLVLATDPSLHPLLLQGKARAAIVSEAAIPDAAAFEALIVVGRARYAMAKLTALFEDKVNVPKGVHPSAVIEEGAEIGPDVAIGAFCYVCKGAVIGARSVLHPQVYIGPDVVLGEDALVYSGTRLGARVRIGARSIIHFNVSIGADGFSFVTPQVGSVEAAKATGAVGATNQELVRIASLGAVVIGDDVEIGANTSIDRGTIVSTRIGNGTKIDNQVQIGHNVVVGDNCLICGRVGIAGSAEIGNRVVLGGATGIADHVKIGDDAIAMGMSGIAGNVAPRSIVGGLPAKARNKMIEDQFNISRLKGLYKKVEALKERLEQMVSSNAQPNA